MENQKPQPARQRPQKRPAPRKKRRMLRMPRTYREFEHWMSCVLGVDAVLFVVYLVAAARDMGGLRVTMAALGAVVSVLALGFMFLNRELNRPRSRWLVTAFCAVLVMLAFSLVFRYPRPAPTAADIEVPTIQASAALNELDAAG